MAAALSLPHPLLVGDIGGTNARFALVATPGGPVGPVWRTRTADAPGPAEAIAWLGAFPRTVVLCTAGPVADRRCHLTNADWVVDGPALAAALNLEQGLLLNDFEALALSLPALGDGAAAPIGPELPPGGGPRLVLGPGTGLGVGALVDAGGRLAALASEAAHLDFAAPDGDAAILARTARVDGRLTAEAVLSGPGLLRLHAARCALDGEARAVADGVALVDAALADPAGPEARTVALFLRLLAGFAGDMTLAFAATGGVWLGGGILPRLQPLIDPVAFRAAFEAKAPVEWLPRRVPVRLIMSPDAVLAGMAAVAADPNRFLIDWPERLWR